MQPRLRSDCEDWVQGIVADRSAICILPERSATAQGIVTRPHNGFMHEREDVTAMLTGSTSANETVKSRNWQPDIFMGLNPTRNTAALWKLYAQRIGRMHGALR